MREPGKEWRLKHIAIMKAGDVQYITGLLTSYDSGSIPEYALTTSAIMSAKSEAIREALARDSSGIIAFEDSNPLGFLVTEKLAYDTEFFGVSCWNIAHLAASEATGMGEITREALIHEFLKKNESPFFVSCRTRSNDISGINSLENTGFRLIDVVVKYFFDLGTQELPRHSFDCTIRDYHESDLEKLKDIAGTFTETRFHYDPNFRLQAPQFWRQHIENASKGMADKILVAELDGKAVGFLTLKIESDLNRKIGLKLGRMVFAAIDPTVRGRGLYTSLIWAGLNYFAPRCNLVESAFAHANNVAVQRAWQRLGFKPAGTYVTFHLWRK